MMSSVALWKDPTRLVEFRQAMLTREGPGPMLRLMSVAFNSKYQAAKAVSRLAIALLQSAALVLGVAAAPAHAADPSKTLRVAFSIAETSFDPGFASDAASDGIIANIFESMLDYDYLARPVKLVPRVLEAMPTVEDGGRTYLCRIRKGIVFTPDPAFKGKPRELTAADFAYSLKRHLDPAVKSPWLWLLEGKLVGGDDARAQAAKTGKFDYDAPLAGLAVVDRYTLRIRLNAPDLRFRSCSPCRTPARWRARWSRPTDRTSALTRSGPAPTCWPSTSAARASCWSPIRISAPRPMRRPGPMPPASQPVAAALKGKRLPLAGRVEVSIIEEGQARWLAFQNRELDFLDTFRPSSSTRCSTTGSSARRSPPRVSCTTCCSPQHVVDVLQHEGSRGRGLYADRIALRRAVGMGYNVDELIRVLAKGRALPASGPIPPDIAGYDPKLRTTAQLYDPAAARALLDKFGYKDRDGDGYRETPDGKPLVLERWSTTGSLARQGDELWKKNMDAIGLNIVFKKDRVPELRKMARLGKIPMRGDGWNADYPDAENFMQLLYGPTRHRRTRRSSICRSSTISTRRRASFPTRRSARSSSIG